MKTTLKNNPVSVGYYVVVACVLIAFCQFAFDGISQIVEWLSAASPSFLTASYAR